MYVRAEVLARLCMLRGPSGPIVWVTPNPVYAYIGDGHHGGLDMSLIRATRVKPLQLTNL